MAFTSEPSTLSAWKTHVNNTPRPFDLVHQNLYKIGALSIDKFLSSSSDDFNVNIAQRAQPDRSNSISSAPPSPPARHYEDMQGPQGEKESAVTQSSLARMQNVARLHQMCQRTFGNSNALKFDYVEEGGSKTKQCILTITRPNGSVRSYKTEPEFTKKTDAKTQAANIAIEMGALDFIAVGDSDTLKAKKGLLVSPLDVISRSGGNPAEAVVAQLPTEENPRVEEIEACCVEWRAGKVVPHWFPYQDPKSGTNCGSALRIQLAPYSFRIYSTDTTYPTPQEAKIACAENALLEGVLDYIKHGNGQTSPRADCGKDQGAAASTPAVPNIAITLQEFYESLPQPFPEPVGDKTASEINAPAWLNTVIQSARGGRLKPRFIWLTDRFPGLHGCLLRLDRPGECKSYLADTKFSRRADAKAAVCLMAMSQGVGDYIRTVAAAVENKVSLYSKNLVNQTIYPLLATECEAIRPGLRPTYDFPMERDAYGCVMKVDISPSPTEPIIHEYTVESEYRTKADAKTAVSCQAAQQGVFELIRFRGRSPSPGYIPFWESVNAETTIMAPRKRKDLELGEVELERQEHKRRRIDVGGDGNQYDNLVNESVHIHQVRKTRAEAGNSTDSSKGPWKKISAPGSSGLVSLGVPVYAGRSAVQRQHGSRSVGNPIASHGVQRFPSHINGAGPSTPYYHHHNPYPPDINGGYGQTAPYSLCYGPQATYDPSLQQHLYPPFIAGNFASVPVYPGPFQMGPQFSPTHPSYSHTYEPIPPYDHYHQAYSQHLPYTSAQPPPRPSPSSAPHRSVSTQPEGGSHPKRGRSADHTDTKDIPGEFSDTEVTGQARKKSKKSRKKKDKGKLRQHTLEGTLPNAPGSGNEVNILQKDGTKGAVPHKSHVTALTDFCSQEMKPQPMFHSETLDQNGETKYKVWLTMGQERLELPATFQNLEEGKERVAKQVLNRLRSKAVPDPKIPV